jgi:hypothetical protein
LHTVRKLAARASYYLFFHDWFGRSMGFRIFSAYQHLVVTSACCSADRARSSKFSAQVGRSFFLFLHQ